MYVNLRVLMIKNHISLNEMSKALKITRNTLSKKINGKAKFSLDEFLKIQAEFFSNVSIEVLSKKD